MNLSLKQRLRSKVNRRGTIL